VSGGEFGIRPGFVIMGIKVCWTRIVPKSS